MTRFARAKGSKSSNERVPEQPTSWSEMRKELLRESVRKAAEEQIERESHLNSSRLQEDRQQPGNLCKSNATEPVEFASFDEDIHQGAHFSGTSEVLVGKVGKKKKNDETSKKKRKSFNDVAQESVKVDFPLSVEDASQVHETFPPMEANTSYGSSSQNYENGGNFKNKQNGKKFQSKPRNDTDQWRSPVKNRNEPRHLEEDQQGDDPLLKISGNFKGYPVPKEDAETLDDAYRMLRKEGLTHKQAMERIKPERRRAEKRLARLKSMVCFRCRKTGHKLSDCPLADVQCDVCFKCGSSTHKYQDCKKKGSFVNAKCFICGATGHLSSQCPDNPHGVYPRGGQCKICGEKSHLVKDCPENKKKKEIHPGTTEFDDHFDSNESTSKEPKRKKLKNVQF